MDETLCSPCADASGVQPVGSVSRYLYGIPSTDHFPRRVTVPASFRTSFVEIWSRIMDAT